MDADRYGFVKSSIVGKPYNFNKKIIEEFNCKIEISHFYKDILIEPNCWIEMACDEAKRSVENGGGPFGAVLLQIDDETGNVIRIWKEQNQVVKRKDPTAHAETLVIRSACYELGVIDLGKIEREKSKLFQEGKTSHCELYSSCEPCPMCYSAISWANIPILVFSSSRIDASQEGVGFMDEEMHTDIRRDYNQRKVHVFQAFCSNSFDAFKIWMEGDYCRY